MENFVSPPYLNAAQDAEQMRQWRADLNKTGAVCIPNILTSEGLQSLRDLAQKSREEWTDADNSLSLKKNQLDGTVLGDFAQSDFLQNFGNALLAPFKCPGLPVQKEEMYPVLRVLEGEPGQRGIHVFHFDHTFLTCALPIHVPEDPTQGPLVLYPNVRSFCTNKLYRGLTTKVLMHPKIRNLVSKQYPLQLIPGNAYFFYGYRSYHATGAFDQDQLRVLGLINIGSVQRDTHTAHKGM